MKLVALLARELSEWPKGVHAFAQDQCADVYPWTGVPEYDDDQWIIADDCDVAMGSYISLDIDLAEDYATDIVTRSQWQAERDRQKGGEWKRHRGNSQPVDEGTWVEVKLRCGDIQQGLANAFLWRHADCDVAANIMKFRVISQPQAEEVEYRGPFLAAPIADSETALEYDIELPSGVCSVEANPDYSAGQWHQIEGPFKWRDEVTELNAYIEKFTRERDALIERLASEGFALIPPVVSVVSEFSGDSIPLKDWKIGDIVEVISTETFCDADVRVGDQRPIIDTDSRDGTVKVVTGSWGDEGQYKFIRRA